MQYPLMSYKKYVIRFFAILGCLLLLNVISFLAFLYNPQNYYFRPWEYFPEVAYQFPEYEALWDRAETSDQTRGNFFCYQDSHRTYVSVDDDGYRKNYRESSSYKILVSGDSAVFGSGLSDDETLPWKLAEKLDMPVFNGGGSSLFNILLRPELAGVKLIIDVRAEREIKGYVFNSYGYVDGDGYTPRMINDKDIKEIRSIVPEQRYLFTSIMFRTFMRLLNDLRVLATGGQKEYLYHHHYFTEYDLDNAVASIVRRKNKVVARGKDYIFVGVPAKQTLYKEKLNAFTRNYLRMLTERLRKYNVKTINLLDVFNEQKSLGLYHNYDSHWNSRGTEVAAEEIAGYLAGKKLLAGPQ